MKHILKKIPLMAGMLVVLGVVLYTCGGGGGGGGYGGGSSSMPPAATSTVQVVACSSVTPAVTVLATDALVFSPSAVHVPVGGVVMWTNNGMMTHSVTSGTGGTPDGQFDQNPLGASSSVCLKFTAAGTFNYFCRYHYTSGMTGSVTVP